VDKDSIIHEGQDLEVEMLGDRNVLAKGIGAIALFGEDENTIVSVDQKELTLQEYAGWSETSFSKKKSPFGWLESRKNKDKKNTVFLVDQSEEPILNVNVQESEPKQTRHSKTTLESVSTSKEATVETADKRSHAKANA
jgi:hypothetical protein